MSFVLIVSSLLFFVSGFSSSFGSNVFFPVLSFFRFFLNIIFVFFVLFFLELFFFKKCYICLFVVAFFC